MPEGRLYIWVRNIALILVVVAFVVFFGQPGGGPPVGAVAEVDGERVDQDVFDFFRQQDPALQNLEESGIPPDRLRDLLDRKALSVVVQRFVLAREARRLGLRVTDAEVAQEIRSNPDLARGGTIDREAYERYVKAVGFSPRAYEEEVRRDLLLRKFNRLVAGTVHVSPNAAREMLVRERTSVQLRYAVSRADAFRERAQPGDEQVQALVKGESERLQAAYQRRRGEFVRGEQVRARHLLFKGEGGLERARSARSRLLAGEDFTAVARQVSDDEATRERGGDLGFFPRGRMVAALEEAAFALPIGDISEPVETQFGVHVLRVEERREAIDRPLEEVSTELARDLLVDDAAARAAQEAAEAVAGRVAGGERLADAARAAGLPVEETPAFQASAGAVPGLGPVPGLLEAAFELRPDAPDSPRLFPMGGDFYLISLVERREPEPAEIEAELEARQEDLTNAARAQVLMVWYAARLRELEASDRIRRYSLEPQ